LIGDNGQFQAISEYFNARIPFRLQPNARFSLCRNRFSKARNSWKNYLLKTTWSFVDPPGSGSVWFSLWVINENRPRWTTFSEKSSNGPRYHVDRIARPGGGGGAAATKCRIRRKKAEIAPPKAARRWNHHPSRPSSRRRFPANIPAVTAVT
jgi:hypothetical protein